jgi:hypothetical protein
MKVLIDVRSVFESGLGVYVRENISRLSSSDLKIKLLLKREDLPAFYQLDLGYDERDIILIDFDRYSVRNLFHLNRILSQFDLYWMPFLSVAPFSKIRKIVTIHDLCPVSFMKFFGFKIAFLYWILLLIQIYHSVRLPTQ